MSAAIAQFPAERFVYVIGATDGPQKIGIAANPTTRLAGIQTGSALRLEVFALVAVAQAEARAVEAHAHSLLQDRRIRGEWFDVSPAEARCAVERAVVAVREGKMEAHRKPNLDSLTITPAQNRIGRAALDWTTAQLSKASGVSIATINRFERGSIEPTAANLMSLRRALEDAGLIVQDADANGGPGIRLRKPERAT
jgi:hypothetical protein